VRRTFSLTFWERACTAGPEWNAGDIAFFFRRRKVERKPKKPKKTTTDTTAESDHVAEEPSKEPKIENAEGIHDFVLLICRACRV
jgi:hypothetical protein